MGELALRHQRGIQAHRGSPSTIADTLQSWFEAGACDGFMLSFATLSDGLTRFSVHALGRDMRTRGHVATGFRVLAH